MQLGSWIAVFFAGEERGYGEGRFSRKYLAPIPASFSFPSESAACVFVGGEARRTGQRFEALVSFVFVQSFFVVFTKGTSI
jgi:hypothetical protein